MTRLQTVMASVVCGVIAGGFAYLETDVIVLAILAAVISAAALAISLPRQPIPVKRDTHRTPLPRAAVASTGLLLAVGVALSVWRFDWTVAAVTAGAAVFWLALIVRRQRP